MKTTLLTVALVAISTSACGSSGASAEEDDSTMAGVMCEEFIEQRVDRADIEHGDWMDATVTGKGNGPYTVKSRFSIDGPWIDYTCKIRHVPDSDEWRLVDLTVDR